jgi:ribonuclease HII
MSEAVLISQMTIGQIRELLSDGGSIDGEVLSQMRADGRLGVRELGRRTAQRHRRRAGRERHFRKMTAVEGQLRENGCRAVVGLDESGRGPLAGPLVAAAVISPWPCRWMGLDDSKSLTPQAREEWYRLIMSQAQAIGVGLVSATRIDQIGLQQANWEAMRSAIVNLSMIPDHVVVDGPWTVPQLNLPQTPLVRGDARAISVAAASVVAKVTRDRMMRRLDGEFPRYGFARHKGYGTREHLTALRTYGPCRVHRRSFGPVSSLMNRQKGSIPPGPTETP